LTVEVVGLTVGVVMVLLPPLLMVVGKLSVTVVGAPVVLLVPLVLETMTMALVVVDGLGMDVVLPVTVDVAKVEEAEVVDPVLDLVELVPELEMEIVAELDDEEVVEPPTMWNGLEYWKVDGALSREILIP
jgi:hypothetical protein